MKLTCALMATMCAVASVPAIAAQETTAATSTPLPSDERRQPRDDRERYDWTKVRGLTPGVAVVVELKRSPSTVRYFVRADESQLTTLRFETRMSESTKQRLLDSVSRYPESFASPSPANELVEGDMRVGPDGVFMAGKKVADLEHLIERVARAEVEAVSWPVPPRGPVRRMARGLLMGIGGYFAGAMAGGMIGGIVHCGIGSCEDSIPSGVVVGLAAGGIAGAITGYRWGSRAPGPKHGDMIYRAP